MSYDTAQPYLAVFVIFKKAGKIAFLLRSNTSWMNGHYGLPSGKVEVGEAGLAGAIREIKEEVAVDIKPEDLELVLTMHRQNKGNHAPEWLDLIFEARSWEGELTNAEPDLHGELAWLDPNNLPENMVPPVQAAIEAIIQGKNYAEYGW